MRTFGGFKSQDRFFYGEVRAEEIDVLAQPYWLGIRTTGEILPLDNVEISIPVAPSKLIAVGLNYADHIAEMRRTPLAHRSFGSKRQARSWHTMAQSRSRIRNTRPISRLSSRS